MPKFKADGPAIVVLIALLAGLWLAGRDAWGKPSRALWLVIAAGLLMLPAVVIARAFGRLDMLALLFHLNMGTEGAGLGAVKNQIIQACVSIIVIVLCYHCLASLWQWRTKAAVGLALALVLANPATQFGLSSLLRAPVQSHLAQQIVQPVLAKTDPGDVVVIFLEGLDRQFADPAVWGDVYAPLAQLATEGLSLTGVRQVTGTGWSIAGQMASLCGVPALPSGLAFGNNYSKIAAFMPQIKCLGDVLKPMHYQASLLTGVDINFAGTEGFFRDHGFPDRIGLKEISQSLPAAMVEKSLVDWVIDDHALMAAARATHAHMLQQPAPFLLVMATIGPHGAEGYLAHNCSASGRAEQTRDANAILRCLIGETLTFVRYLQAEQAAKRPERPLHILLLSDHMSHNVDTPPVAPAYQGANTVIFLSPNVTPGTVNAREASMLDVFPTLLQVLGLAQVPVAGNLGRSVLSAPATLFETQGYDGLDAAFSRDGALAAAVWR